MADDTNRDDSKGPFDSEVVNQAWKRFNIVSEWEGTSRDRYIEDLKFAEADSDNGYQWPNAIRRARDIDAKPCLTLNVTRQHNLQIINKMKKQRNGVAVKATGNGATKESADVLAGIIRHIEYHSMAQDAYDIGRQFQVKAGIGWWRLTTDYANSETFDHEIFIRQVKDPLSVYMDPNIREISGLDAKWAFVFDDVPRDEFNEAYPEYKDKVANNPMQVASAGADWVSKNHVRVAEYFRRVPKRQKLLSFVDPASGERKTMLQSRLHPAIVSGLLDDPLTRWRMVTDEQVEWYLIAGDLTIDKTLWPGRYIPLIRVLGEETVIEGIMDRKGHTRAMKDGQRMYNYSAALSIHTKIPTPTGWTTMGQIQDGDWVYDQKGFPVQVAKALPVKIGESCYKITFDTGYTVTTDASHIWRVEARGKRMASGFIWTDKTLSTEELIAGKHFVQVAEPISSLEKNLLIDSYILGLWLGDGVSKNAQICGHLDDIEEEKRYITELGYTVGETNQIRGQGGVFNVFGLKYKLRELGVLNDKHVPSQYLRGSYEQRLALLQGLMDSDGHYAKPVNQCSFTNNSHDLIRSMMELCASLGIKATVSRNPQQVCDEKKGYISKRSFTVIFTADQTLPVFRLRRKLEQQSAVRNAMWRRTKRHGIKSIEKVESVPVRCLTLDTPDHLYLCSEGMIPTHNSGQVEFVNLQSKTPWVAPAKAIEEYESYWNTANQTNHSVLPWNHLDDDGNPIPPPMRQEPPTASPAYEIGMTTAFNQMMMTSGQWQNQMGMGGNERTGEAISQRVDQGDLATFHYDDNYGRAIRTTGVQLIDLIPKVYDTKRVVMIMAEDGTDQEVEIDPTARQAYLENRGHQAEVIKRIFNPQLGQYQVQADIGPAFGTRREQTVNAMTLLLTQAPALVPIIGDLLLKAMDFKEAQEASIRLKRMVPPQAMGQGQSEQEQLLGQQVQALQGALAKALEELGKAKVKLAGKAQQRSTDIYDAETKRLSALADMLPQDPEGSMALINQLVSDALQTSLMPILKANHKLVDNQSGGPLEVPQGTDTLQ